MAFGKGYFSTLAEGAVNAATGGLLGVGLDAISGAINNKYQKQIPKRIYKTMPMNSS